LFRTIGPILSRLGTSILGEGDIQNCSNESLPKEIAKQQKYTDFFKIFSRTSRPISIKLGTDHP
jgi:hypothetical protein